MNDSDETTLLFDGAVRSFAARLERAKIEHPPKSPLACQAGCDHCCHQRQIAVTAIEVFRIADFMSERFRAPEIAALIRTPGDDQKRRVSAATEPESQTLRPCPLLKDGGCSVYEVRPLVCRGVNSFDVSDCEQARREKRLRPTVKHYAPQIRAANLSRTGLWRKITAAGREADRLDLAPALRIALGTPDAKDRWLKGDTVFAAACLGLGRFPTKRNQCSKTA